MVPDTAHGIVLFDGTCAFCERSVIFIANRDPAGYFRFGASQTPEAAALLAPFNLTRETARSIILIEGGAAYLRSTATLRIAAHLPFPWSLARLFLHIPAPLRDAGLPRRRGRPAPGRRALERLQRSAAGDQEADDRGLLGSGLWALGSGLSAFGLGWA